MYEAKAAGRNTCRAWKSPLGAQSASGLRRVLKAGRIVFNGGTSTIDCTVRALGETGARLDVVTTAGIPDRFKLAIMDDGLSRACQVSVKHGLTFEVNFL
jgi:hypothetical protein